MYKVPVPNYTETPNIFLDHWLPHLKEVELKVLLVIFRKTFGWHKVRDRISLSQLSQITGCARDKVSLATKALEKKGLVRKIVSGKKGEEQTIYELILEEDSNNSDQSPKATPPSSQKLPTKETLTKDNERYARAKPDQAKVTVRPKPMNVQNVQNTEPKEQKPKAYKNKPIPHFIRFKSMKEEDWQILANQFTEAELSKAVEDAKSFHKNIEPIKNMAAFLTERAKFYKNGTSKG